MRKRVAILLLPHFSALRIRDTRRLQSEEPVLGMCPLPCIVTHLILHSTDQIRVEPAVRITATVTRFPSNVPIDYFEPSFFNQMSVHERAVYMDNGVALPIPEICADGSRIGEWKNLPYNEFMEKFGNDTLKLYNLPTEAELEQLQEYDDEDSDEDED